MDAKDMESWGKCGTGFAVLCVCRPVTSVLVLPLGFFAVSDFQHLKENILHPFVECGQCQRSLPGNPKVSMLLIEGSVCCVPYTLCFQATRYL